VRKKTLRLGFSLLKEGGEKSLNSQKVRKEGYQGEVNYKTNRRRL